MRASLRRWRFRGRIQQRQDVNGRKVAVPVRVAPCFANRFRVKQTHEYGGRPSLIRDIRRPNNDEPIIVLGHVDERAHDGGRAEDRLADEARYRDHRNNPLPGVKYIWPARRQKPLARLFDAVREVAYSRRRTRRWRAAFEHMLEPVSKQSVGQAVGMTLQEKHQGSLGDPAYD